MIKRIAFTLSALFSLVLAPALAQYSGAPASVVGYNKGQAVSNTLYAGSPFAGLFVAEIDGLGRDSELEETPQNLLVEQLVSHTLGTVYGHNAVQYCDSPGDCIPFISEAYNVGVDAAQNEGEDWHIRLQENGYVFQGTVNSYACSSSPAVCTWNLTQTQGWGAVPFGATRQVGIQLGEGLQLIDITHGYSTGSISAISAPLITGSGVNWDSTFGDTFAQAVTTAAVNNGGGPNSFPQTNVTVSTGAWTGTFTVSATPVCFFDTEDTRYQCAKITAVSANASITVDRLQWPITSGSAVDQGGLTGYCFGMDLDIVSASGLNGYGNPTDAAVVNPIRRCQPIQFNTSGNTLTLYVNASGETAFVTRANPAVAGSGAYHIYPAAMTETVLNAASGQVDGGGITTTPFVGTFATNDTVEQPHYYAGRGGNLNWASDTWQNAPGWASSFNFNVGGSGAVDGYPQGYITNANSPTIYWGLPSALSMASTPGYGNLFTPHGVDFGGPYASAIHMNTPPFGEYYQMGGLYISCGGPSSSNTWCQDWNQNVWMLTVQNRGGTGGATFPYAEDSLAYNPYTYTWSLSSGGTGPNGGSAPCTQLWGPTGWSQTGVGCSAPTQLVGSAAFINLASGITAQPASTYLPTNNIFAQGFTDLNDGGYSWGTFAGKDSLGNQWKYNIMNSGNSGWGFCVYSTASGPVTVTTPSQLAYCHQLSSYGTVNDTIPTEVIGMVSSATGGSGVSSVSCASSSCTNLSGSYAISPGTFATGNLLTLVWPATPTAYKCLVAQNGGAGWYAIGHAAASTTGLVITNGFTVSGAATFTVDYVCSPN